MKYLNLLKRIPLIICLFLLVGTCAQVTWATQVDVTYTGLEGIVHQVKDDFVLYSVKETQSSGDLNGDGDTLDEVLHLFNHKTMEIQNIGFVGYQPLMNSRYVVFSAFEGQGAGDLNGNGRLNDLVPQTFDIASGVVTNLGLSAQSPVFSRINENLYAFVAWEVGQGKDLNGDGVLSANVLHIHDFRTGETRNVGVDASARLFELSLSGELIGFAAYESNQGGMDLNGDGDATDPIAFFYDFASDRLINTAKAGIPVVSGGKALLGVFEDMEGNIDLDGNGIVGGQVLYQMDLQSNQMQSMGLTLSGLDSFTLGENENVFFQVDESLQDEDLNADHDHGDHVLHYYRASDNTIHNIGLASRFLAQNGDVVLVSAREDANGVTDMNGDGDFNDQILQYYNVIDGSLTNSGTIAPWSILVGNTQLGSIFLNWERNTDWNGDGDSRDSVITFYNKQTFETIHIPFLFYSLHMRAML